MKVHPYLNFAGNAEEAFSYYQDVFGGEFTSLVRFKDMPMEGVTLPEGAEDKIMHITLAISDDVTLMASDALEGFGETFTQGNNVHISIHPTSREEADRIFDALSDGGQVQMSMADQAWGDYYGSLRDRFGVMWMVNHHEEA